MGKMETNEMVDDIFENFFEKFKKCGNCRVEEGREKVCNRHKMMIGKYLRKKHNTKITEMAKVMKDVMVGGNPEKGKELLDDEEEEVERD